MRHEISSDGEWSGLLARIGSVDALDASAGAFGALTRRRGVRDGASLLRLGLGYGPGGMSLREVSAWARMQGIAEVSDVALLNRLRHAADWFGSLAGQVLSSRAGAEDIGERPLRLVDGTVLTAPGGQGADWRLHMGYDPRGCRFTDFELTDGKGAERLDRFAARADEIRIADRGFGSRPDSIRVVTEGPGDYLVRVHWRGLHWLDAKGDRFDMMAFLRGLGEAESGEAHILIGRGKNRTGQAPFAARLVALRLPDDKVQAARHRIAAENRRKSRQVQPETLEAAAHVLLLTSLDPEDYPAARLGALYRLRWQVELAFKRLKSLLNLDALRARDPDLARAWIYTNLLAAFLIDDMIRPAPDSPP
jgi:IS4 transposase